MNISAKKNILYIRDSGGIFGAERVILTLARGIDKELFNIFLLCMEGGNGNSRSLVNRAIQSGISVETIRVNGRFDIAALMKIRKVLKRRQIDIIHSHDYKSNLYGLLASIGLPVKRILTAHGATRDSLLKRLYLFIDVFITYRFFDIIIAVSEDLYRKLIKKGISKDHLAIIKNGLDLTLNCNNFIAQEQLKIPGESKVFAVVGRLFPDKGHRYFLEAFSRIHRRYPNTFGLIVGDGPSYEEINRQVKEYGLSESISLCGLRYDMDSVYKQIDYLVIPSLTEGLPYVLLEAMAFGIPVVATSVGDIPKLIDDGKTGYTVNPGDSDQLADKMALLMEDPIVAEHMAKRAKMVVETTYSAQQMIYQTEQMYQKIIGLGPHLWLSL